MEIAKLILEFISVLIWPIVILCVGLRFRSSIDRMLERISRESRQIDLEIGGQKVSVKLAEKVLSNALEEAAGKTARVPVSIDQVKHDALHTLRLMAKLGDENVEVMRLLPVTLREVADNFEINQKSAIGRLGQLGLVTSEDGYLKVTELGERARNLLGAGDLQEALHKISQAM